jgi:hypothetical protein
MSLFSSVLSQGAATAMSLLKPGEPVYKYYITPLKARYTPGTVGYGPGYELIVKMHRLASTSIPIKVYKGGPGSKHIKDNIICQEIDETFYPQIRAHILGMKCGALNNGYILSNFNKDHTCSILQYMTDHKGNPTTLNTIIVFGYSINDNCPEVIAICSQGGGGNPFNYFLNLAKAALRNLRNFQFKVVLEALSAAQPFYRSFNFSDDGAPDGHGSKDMKRTISGNSDIDSGEELITDIDEEALQAVNVTIEKAKTPEAQQESTVAIAAHQAEETREYKIKKQKAKSKNVGLGNSPSATQRPTELREDNVLAVINRYTDINPGTDTAGGNMNKIKNKTVNLLFRPFRILTKGSVKKSNKKRSKRRITNKRKTRKNN